MKTFSESVEIAVPPDRVWQALTRPEEVVCWDTGIVEPLDALWPTPGPRVVDEDVDAAPALDSGRNHRLDLRALADIGRDEQRLTTECLDLAHRARARFCIVLRNEDASPFPRIAASDAAADPLAGSGDDRDAIL